MRHILLVLTLIVLVSPAVAETPQKAPAEPQVSPDAQVSLEDLLIPVQSVEGEATQGVCDLPSALHETGKVDASSCPFGSPECQVDDDCDDYCGDPAFGNCERLGFFPFGCCVCLG